MKDQGLGSWTARRARMTPGKAALVQDGQVTSYAELHRAATALALGLRQRGIGRGDRVAFLGLNSAELVIAMFAVAKLGAVFVPLNTRLAPPELAVMLADSGAKLLLCETALAGRAPVAEGGAVGADLVEFERSGGSGLAFLAAPAAVPQAAGRAGPGAAGPAAEAVAELDEPVAQDDLFMIQYTSGTSGRPKGVMLTHANIIWNVYNLLVDIDLHSDEVALVTAPLFHTAALNQVLFPALLKGGTALLEARFDPARAIELIESERVTLLFGVTSMYLALAAAPRFAAADLGSLRLALSGGAPVPEALLRTWLDRGLMIIQGYGLTESSPGATMLRAADGVRKLGSAGTACFFADVRVVAPDLSLAGPGEPGEVLVSGPQVTPGYWQNPDATAAAFEDEWLRTGDLAVTDADGYLRIVDRVKDMFISGGENVYPAEVEQALYRHPAVAECAVIGVPHPDWGEVGRAFVVRRGGLAVTESELLAALDGRLGRYKIPKSVVFVSGLPHNAAGKLAKAQLRQAAAEQAGPEQAGKG